MLFTLKDNPSKTYTYDNIKLFFPNISFPAQYNNNVKDSLGIIEVLPTPHPDINPIIEYIEEASPKKRGNDYVQQWKIVPKYTNSEEKKALLDEEDARKTKVTVEQDKDTKVRKNLDKIITFIIHKFKDDPDFPKL